MRDRAEDDESHLKRVARRPAPIKNADKANSGRNQKKKNQKKNRETSKCLGRFQPGHLGKKGDGPAFVCLVSCVSVFVCVSLSLRVSVCHTVSCLPVCLCARSREKTGGRSSCVTCKHTRVSPLSLSYIYSRSSRRASRPHTIDVFGNNTPSTKELRPQRRP